MLLGNHLISYIFEYIYIYSSGKDLANQMCELPESWKRQEVGRDLKDGLSFLRGNLRREWRE